MQIPTPVMARIRQFVSAYPLPAGDPNNPAWDDLIRSWTVKLCAQIRNDFGQQWGAKRASSTRPIGKDSLAYVKGENLYSWDLLVGAGTGSPQLAADPTFYDLTGSEQVFEAVNPHDYLGGSTSVDQSPGSSPSPGGNGSVLDTAAIAAMFNALSDSIQAQAQRIYDQNERIYADLVARLNALNPPAMMGKSIIPSVSIPQISVGLPGAQTGPGPDASSSPRLRITPEVAETVASIAAGIVKALHR